MGVHFGRRVNTKPFLEMSCSFGGVLWNMSRAQQGSDTPTDPHLPGRGERGWAGGLQDFHDHMPTPPFA